MGGDETQMSTKGGAWLRLARLLAARRAQPPPRRTQPFCYMVAAALPPPLHSNRARKKKKTHPVASEFYPFTSLTPCLKWGFSSFLPPLSPKRPCKENVPPFTLFKPYKGLKENKRNKINSAHIGFSSAETRGSSLEESGRAEIVGLLWKQREAQPTQAHRAHHLYGAGLCSCPTRPFPLRLALRRPAKGDAYRETSPRFV